jgi:hypothetical protein
MTDTPRLLISPIFLPLSLPPIPIDTDPVALLDSHRLAAARRIVSTPNYLIPERGRNEIVLSPCQSTYVEPQL